MLEAEPELSVGVSQLVETPAFARLQEVDATIDALPFPRRSLDPRRGRATSFTELFGELLKRHPAVADPEGLADGLGGFARGVVRNFPENLFWDFELLGMQLARANVVDRRERVASLERLHIRFGSAPIAFRYLHDFLYGFDWARWVRRAPADRAGVGPFDPPFLAYLEQRGEELLVLIAEDDTKYPELPAGQPRNPFGFSREPEDERRLMQLLEARQLIPARAFDFDAVPDATLDYVELRRAAARELGL